MLNLHKILFATDLSHNAQWAGLYARMLGRATGAEVHVLFADVLHGDAAGPAGLLQGEAALEAMHAQTAAARSREDNFADVRIRHAIVRDFSPTPAILHYSEEEDVDLIVTGTHGRRGLTRLVLGSVAEEILRLATCPVLTVRGQEAPIPYIVDIDAVIVPIDFSPCSREALPYGRELAALYEASLEMVHVVEETLHSAFYGITVQSIYDVHGDIEERAKKQMILLFEEIGGPAVRANVHAMPGHAGREVVRFAANYPNSLVVMGTHGLTGLNHFLIGSTTERVLRRISAPVLSVKATAKRVVERSEVVKGATAPLLI